MPERVSADHQPGTAAAEEPVAEPARGRPLSSPQRILAMQRLVGNHAVAQMIARDDPPGMTSGTGASSVAPGAQASTASPEQVAGRKRIDAALKDFTQGNFKGIQEPDWALAGPEEKMKLLDKATAGTWLLIGPGDELAIEACWRSFDGGFTAAVESNPGVWTRSVVAGADPENIPATKGKLALLKGTTLELAEKSLDANEDTVIAEMKSWGLTPPAALLRDPSKGGKSSNVGAMARTPELKRKLDEQAALAKLVIRHERRLAELRTKRVGRGGEPFDPNIKPVEDWELIPGVSTWQMVNEPWERTTAEIGLILNAWPVLYAAHGQDALGKIAFPESDEANLGLEGLKEAQAQLERTLAAINTTRVKLKDDDDAYLNLVPVHRQLWKGKALSPAGNAYSRSVMLPILNDEKAAKDDIEAAKNIGVDLALFVAVLAGAIGTLGGAAVAVGIAGARAMKAEDKASELGAAYGAAVSDENALVTKAAVTAAQADAEAAKIDLLMTVVMEAQGVAIHHLADPKAGEALGQRFKQARAGAGEGEIDDLRAKARGMQSEDPALAGSRGAAGRPVGTGPVKDWGGVAHADRPKQLEPLVNMTLESKNVPKVRVEPAGKLGNRFDHETWTIHLEDGYFADGIRQSEYEEMIRALWHEADHVDAWYGMARAKAPEFKSPQELADAMTLRTPRARQAAIDAYANPMKASDPKHAEMLRFWERIYGSGAEQRNQVFKELDAAEKQMNSRGTVFEVAANNYDIAPKVISPEKRDELLRRLTEAEEKWKAARADYEKAYKAYSELPEEARAFATEQWRVQWARDAVRGARVNDAESRLGAWRKRVESARATRAGYEAAHAEQAVLDELDLEIATAQDHADVARSDLKKALLM